VHVKSSLAPRGPSLEFVLSDGRLKWTGVSDIDYDGLVRQGLTPDQRGAREDAKGFLLTILTGGDIAATRIREEAGSAGISMATLRRAKSELGVKTVRQSTAGDAKGAGQWVWTLNGHARSHPPSRVGEHLEERIGRADI